MADEDIPSQETDNAAPGSPTPGSTTLRITGVNQCAVVYANVGTVLSTPFDLQLVFGELREVTPDGIALAQAAVRVVMTPEVAEITLRALEERLRMYINRHGALREMEVRIGGESMFMEGGKPSIPVPPPPAPK